MAPRPRHSPGSVATLLAVLLLALVGLSGLAAQAPPAEAAPASPTAAAAPAAAPAAEPDPGGPEAPHARVQAPPPGADADGEAVRALPIRAPHHPHGGGPYPTALPWPAAADPWYVLAAGGPPGFRAPDRVAEPLVRTAPRADRAPPAPAGT